nr:reverse transcriptase domain-containing protein [Tanacetum cinerariifolium]
LETRPTEGYEDAIVILEITANNFELKHAWESFNDLLRACPHHGFFELHQLDTFYNALNVNDQDSLNSAAGGNFLDKMPRECLKIIKSKSKVRQSRAKAVVVKVGMSSSTPVISSDVGELKDVVKALLLDKKNQSLALTPSTTPAPVKAVEPNCAPIPQTQRVSQTDFESYVKANDAILRNMQSQGQSTQNQCQNIQNQYQNLQNQIATLTDMMTKLVSANTASSSGLGTLPGNTVTNPKEELKGITTRSDIAYQGPKTPSPCKQGTKVTKDQVQAPSSQNTAPVLPAVIQSESQASVSEPVVAPVTLIGNKEKLSEMARTTMNEHCSAVILNKFPRKLGDPEKFLIPCEFSRMDECLALADLVWEGLSLPELTPTCMTLKLADRSVSKPIGIAKDVSFKVGVFHFPADFVVVDFEHDPRVPLILERCFPKTSRALIDVHKGELTLRIENEVITYNLDQIVRYSAMYNQMTANKIDVVESACEEYSKEEADAFLGLEDDPDSLKINPFYYDPEGDILLLEAILNSEPSPPLPNQEQNLPSFKEELKAYE